MMELFHTLSHECSRITAKLYSTSFYSAIRLLHKDIRQPICDIYGFVRLADEIVDTFHAHDKRVLLEEFKIETWLAIKRGISLNPVLHSFQRVVNKYYINHDLVHSFLASMETDLNVSSHQTQSYKQYIYGSAEAVGLMCLQVFCDKDEELYRRLKPNAQSLGSAFQKVNFLRDSGSDYRQLNRSYFPGVDFADFSPMMKTIIEKDIQQDFDTAYKGIRRLPLKARFGVYVAYKYYYSLFKKISRVKAANILEERVRIPNYSKALILVRAGLKNQLRLL